MLLKLEDVIISHVGTLIVLVSWDEKQLFYKSFHSVLNKLLVSLLTVNEQGPTTFYIILLLYYILIVLYYIIHYTVLYHTLITSKNLPATIRG